MEARQPKVFGDGGGTQRQGSRLSHHQADGRRHDQRPGTDDVSLQGGGFYFRPNDLTSSFFRSLFFFLFPFAIGVF